MSAAAVPSTTGYRSTIEEDVKATSTFRCLIAPVNSERLRDAHAAAGAYSIIIYVYIRNPSEPLSMSVVSCTYDASMYYIVRLSRSHIYHGRAVHIRVGAATFSITHDTSASASECTCPSTPIQLFPRQNIQQTLSRPLALGSPPLPARPPKCRPPRQRPPPWRSRAKTGPRTRAAASCLPPTGSSTSTCTPSSGGRLASSVRRGMVEEVQQEVQGLAARTALTWWCTRSRGWCLLPLSRGGSRGPRQRRRHYPLRGCGWLGTALARAKAASAACLSLRI